LPGSDERQAIPNLGIRRIELDDLFVTELGRIQDLVCLVRHPQSKPGLLRGEICAQGRQARFDQRKDIGIEAVR
jgi:hypothetical protein